MAAFSLSSNNATTVITSATDVEHLLNHFQFEKVTRSGSVLRSACKLHGGNNPTSFVINEENGLYFCHACGRKGDLFTLVGELMELDFPASIKWLAEFSNVDLSNCTIPEKRDYLALELDDFVKFVRKQQQNKTLENYVIDEKAVLGNVKTIRNFSEETIKHFGVKYAEKIPLRSKEDNEYILEHRLLFPIIFNGKQIGVNIRRIKESDYPKWSLQPVSINYGYVLYNYDNVKTCDEVVLCEGIYDVFAFHEIGVPAVGMFGAHITNEQYQLILRLGCDITLAFDGDDAGHKARDLGIKLFSNKSTIRVVDIPAGHDPASVTRDELKYLFDNRRRTKC